MDVRQVCYAIFCYFDDDDIVHFPNHKWWLSSQNQIFSEAFEYDDEYEFDVWNRIRRILELLCIRYQQVCIQHFVVIYISCIKWWLFWISPVEPFLCRGMLLIQHALSVLRKFKIAFISWFLIMLLDMNRNIGDSMDTNVQMRHSSTSEFDEQIVA